MATFGGSKAQFSCLQANKKTFVTSAQNSSYSIFCKVKLKLRFCLQNDVVRRQAI